MLPAKEMASSLTSSLGSPKPVDKFLSGLLFFSWLFACMDKANIEVAGMHIKIAFVVFPTFFLLLLFRYGAGANRTDLGYSLVFLGLLVPSVLTSIAIGHSFAFLIGAGVCVTTMLVFAMLVSRLGIHVISIMVAFYRFTIITTCFLVALRIQERGCFTFYESSYYAIALVPYFCISFYRLSVGGLKAAGLDGLFILAAVAATQSFSLVFWAFVSFAWLRIKARKERPIQLVAILGLITVLITIAANTEGRTQSTLEILRAARWDPEWFATISIHVAGNRIQRIYMAWDIAQIHRFMGVGLGAFKIYTTDYLGFTDYSIMGISADDFEVDTNAVCIYLELLAEAGILGCIGFSFILFRVYHAAKSRPFTMPLVIAFLITMLSLIIESSYLRPYVWALYGTLLGLSRTLAKCSLADFYLPASQHSSPSFPTPVPDPTLDSL